MTKTKPTVSTQLSAQYLWEQLVRLLMPVECLGCRQEGSWICNNCLKQLPLSQANRCLICTNRGQDGLCPSCKQSLALNGLISLFHYHEPVIKNLIGRAKSAGQHDALSFIISLFVPELIRRLPPDQLAIVPIPLSRDRLNQRGFNQAEPIAQALSQGTGYPVWHGLVKTKDTPAQANLERLKRLKNPNQSFGLTKPPPVAVLLVDDVVTTGSTLKVASRLLRRHGSKQVWSLTVAHG